MFYILCLDSSDGILGTLFSSPRCTFALRTIRDVGSYIIKASVALIKVLPSSTLMQLFTSGSEHNFLPGNPNPINT